MKRRLPLLLCLALVVACAPTYKRLPELDAVPDMASVAHQGVDRHQNTWALEVGEAEGEEYFIVADEYGPERGDELVVLIHGFASDRTTWQFVTGHLSDEHRLWVPDQLGCGESGRPDPAVVGAETYGATGAARNLLEALRQRNEEAGWPDRIVFVGHSLGGAVALRILGEETLRDAFPEIYKRIDRAVLIAPLEFAVHRADSTMNEMATAGGFKIWLARTFRILQERVSSELIASAEDPRLVFRFDADRIIDAFRGKEARRATQAILRQTVPFDEEGRPDWHAIEELVADYDNVEVPVLLMWGRRDETLSLAMGHKLLDELPDARLLVLREGKHSLQADRPAEVAEWIDRFLDDPGVGWKRVEEID